MAKKTKLAKTEPLEGDILDLIWAEVINPDPEGAWLDDALKKSADAPELLKAPVAAIQRLLATKASREDLGRFAREHRYNACIGLLYMLNDPGLKSGKLTGLVEMLLNPAARNGKEKKFLTEFWGEDSGEVQTDPGYMPEPPPDETEKNEPFGDVPPATFRLFKAGATPEDLGLFITWLELDASVECLRLFERAGITEANEVWLNDRVLGAEPSGKEAFPGSWPLPKPAKTPAAASKDPTQPFLVLKSIEYFGFTPDGKGLIVQRQTGPLRILDSETGEERLVLAAKGFFEGWVFSRDSKRIFIIADPNKIFVCDMQTGKLLQTFKGSKEMLNLRLRKLRGGAQFLIHCYTGEGDRIHYFQFDIDTLKIGQEMTFLPENTTSRTIAWSPDGRTLFANFATNETVIIKFHLCAWSWPELKPLWTATPPKSVEGIRTFSDGRSLALLVSEDELAVLSAATGERLTTFKTDEKMKDFSFTEDNRYLVTAAKSGDKIRIWDFAAQRIVRELNTGPDGCYYGVFFSPDGKTLGTLGLRNALFWRFDALL